MNGLLHREGTPIPVLLTESALFDLIRLVAASPRLSHRKVASALGFSLGKANYYMRALVEQGLVKAQSYRKKDHKLGYVYLLTPAGIAAKAELTRYFLARKTREYEELGREIEQLQLESAAIRPEREEGTVSNLQSDAATRALLA